MQAQGTERKITLGTIFSEGAKTQLEVRAPDWSAHTLVCAQSGSGKSFFAGRSIEEILLNTKMRIAVIDPNSDYSQFDIVQWQDSDKTTQSDRRAFELAWATIDFSILQPSSVIDRYLKDLEHIKANEDIKDKESRELLLERGKRVYTPLKIPISGLRSNHFDGSVADRSPETKIKIESCLKCIVWLEGLPRATPNVSKNSDSKEFLQSCQLLISMAPVLLQSQFNEQVFSLFGVDKSLLAKMNSEFEQIKIDATRVDQATATLVFSQLEMLAASGLLRLHTKSMLPASKRLTSLDLPTVPLEFREIVLDVFLSEIWDAERLSWEEAKSAKHWKAIQTTSDSNQAPIGEAGEKSDNGQAEQRVPLEVVVDESSDKRVPLIVVVDEAHNIAPKHEGSMVKPSSLIIRRMAAEGRKLGLRLFLITQRPDKLDPLVVSECENRLLMRISSNDVLFGNKGPLGLSGLEPKEMVDFAKACSEFSKGMGYIRGPWLAGLSVKNESNHGYHKFQGLLRRTREGGSNIPDSNYVVSDNA